MRKSDFTRGSDCALIYAEKGLQRFDSNKAKIIDAKVSNVGQRYITVANIDFDSTRGFVEDTVSTEKFLLFPSRLDAEKFIEHCKQVRFTSSTNRIKDYGEDLV